MGADFDAIIAQVRAFGDFASEVAKEAAPLVEEAIKKTAAAGTDINGRPWKPKADGGRPLVHAADAVTVKANGPTVIATLSGVEVFHHEGTGRLPRRPILPDAGAGMPEAITRACEEAASRVFARKTGGGR